MELQKRSQLQAQNWSVGSADEFLDLNLVESRLIDLKIASIAEMNLKKAKFTDAELREIRRALEGKA